MNKIQIFITHWVNKDVIEFNDALVEEVTFLEKATITDYPHETIVVYYCPDNSIDEVFDRLSIFPNVKLVKNDRSGRPDTQPSMRNKVIDLADNYFVLLHNDIRVSVGWLTSLVSDFKKAESIYGDKNGDRCIMTPRFIPYHYIPGIIEPKYPAFWKALESDERVSSISKMRQWCSQWKFKFDNSMVYSLPPGHITDDGHQLMMFMSSKKFFTGDGIHEGTGYCDEKYIGWGYDDNDWGITALMKNRKNLKSQTSLIGHMSSMTFGNPKVKIHTPSGNDNIFKNKWGEDIYNEMQTGQLWIRLHNEQRKRGY